MRKSGLVTIVHSNGGLHLRCRRQRPREDDRLPQTSAMIRTVPILSIAEKLSTLFEVVAAARKAPAKSGISVLKDVGSLIHLIRAMRWAFVTDAPIFIRCPPADLAAGLGIAQTTAIFESFRSHSERRIVKLL